MKFMGEDSLWQIMRGERNFGMKSWRELIALLNTVPAPWFEFCL
jgi:hypothetical protein